MSVLEAVRGVLEDTLRLGGRAKNLEQSTPLFGSLPELDSPAVVTIITTIEEDFGIVIDDDEITAETFETVGSLCRFIEQKIGS